MLISTISSSRTGECWPVMLTPFDNALHIDWGALDHLVDWYIGGGCGGLFAVCLSSELFQLTPEERFALAERTIQRAKGRVPVIVSGALGSTFQEIADSVNWLADAGPEAIILMTNQFAGREESDDIWLSNIEACLNGIRPDIKLGLYECPVPYKRLLPPSLIKWAAGTGRFYLMKDTCCNRAQIGAKLQALSGSLLRFYNANTETLLWSLQAGGHGFSGVGANSTPHLYAWLSKNFAANPELAAELQDFLTISCFGSVMNLKYPHAVKSYLRMAGLPIGTACRLSGSEADANDLDALEVFHRQVGVWEARLGVPSPFEYPTLCRAANK